MKGLKTYIQVQLQSFQRFVERFKGIPCNFTKIKAVKPWSGIGQLVIDVLGRFTGSLGRNW